MTPSDKNSDGIPRWAAPWAPGWSGIRDQVLRCRRIRGAVLNESVSQPPVSRPRLDGLGCLGLADQRDARGCDVERPDFASHTGSMSRATRCVVPTCQIVAVARETPAPCYSL